MEIEQILSLRYTERRPWFQIVYEWEDYFSKNLKVTIVGKFLSFLFNDKLECYTGFLGRLLVRRYTLIFQMVALTKNSIYNNKYIIPYIIDYWIPEKEIQLFERAYSKCPLVVISSKQVYDCLINKGCKLKIVHVPLSIPDSYVPQSICFPKKYDFALIGRTNKVLRQFFDKYVKENPSITYVERKIVNGKYVFCDQYNNILSESDGRDEYISFLRASKCTFYSTPGMDGDRTNTNGFSPVTPRFLEGLSCGCHLLMRYPDNSDVNYYEIDKYFECISDYSQFKGLLEKKLSTPVDEATYLKLLYKHTTSQSAKQLTYYLNKL